MSPYSAAVNDETDRGRSLHGQLLGSFDVVGGIRLVVRGSTVVSSMPGSLELLSGCRYCKYFAGAVLVSILFLDMSRDYFSFKEHRYLALVPVLFSILCISVSDRTMLTN